MLSGRAHIAATVALLCATSAARADVLLPAPVSPSAVGRSGAVTAAGDAGWSLTSNPAGLTSGPLAASGRGVDLAALLTLHASHLSHHRRGVDAQVGYPVAETRSGASAAPAAVGRVRWCSGRFALGAGFWDSAREALDYPASAASAPRAIDDPQRYLARHFAARRRTAGVGFAVRPRGWLDLGAAVLLSRVTLELARDGWLGLPPDLARTENPRFDTAAELALTGHAGALALGAIVRPPGSPLALALALEIPTAADLDGHLTLSPPRSPPSGLRSVLLEGAADLAMTVDLPLVARSGVRIAGARADLELDAELARMPSRGPWTASARDARLVTTDLANIQNVVVLDQVPLALASRTRFTLAVGSDLHIVRDFALARIGYSYSSASAPAALWSPATPQGARHGLSFGLAVRGHGVSLEAAWRHTAGASRRITSAWRHWNPLAEDNSEDVGSATVSSATDEVALGISIDLGTLLAKPAE